ncbi:MAG TPA: helix-turn-helix domain-containing protein [archaeon]|nr:helix-turn-helix domain-containing protein [archaeon]
MVGERIIKENISNAYSHIGKKWCVEILCDLFEGKTRFTEFLENNTELSTKMLAQRLAEMQKFHLIIKQYNNETSGHDYVLTENGKKTGKILFAMSEFRPKTLKRNFEKS